MGWTQNKHDKNSKLIYNFGQKTPRKTWLGKCSVNWRKILQWILECSIFSSFGSGYCL